MRDLHFMPKAWEDLGWWLKNDLKMAKKFIPSLKTAAKRLLRESASLNRSRLITQGIGHEGLILNTVSFIIVVHALYGHYQN